MKPRHTDRAVGELMTAMVGALRERGCISRPEVADAFLSVRRDQFVPARPLTEVYSAEAVIPTHFDEEGLAISSSSAPNIMAIMLEQLDVQRGMRVLEIGAGTGYNAALLAHLVGDRGHVLSIDIDEQVASEAGRHLQAVGVPNARVECSDGWLGKPGAAFDRIMATVGAWEVSPHWFEQLRPGGILVMPLWLRPGVQVSVGLVRDAAGLRSTSVCLCGFMRLRGPHAGPDAHVAVSGWGDRVDGAPSEDHWIAAFEYATPERVSALRALVRGPVEAAPVPLPAPGWTTRLALEEPDAIALSGRDSFGHFAFGLFAPERNSLAVFDAGLVVSFGDPYCAQRLRDRLPELAPIDLRELEIRALPHPAGAVPGAWMLERPNLDLVVREGVS